MTVVPLPAHFTSGQRVAGQRVTLVRVPGLVPYDAGLEWQRRLAKARMEGWLSDDLLILLEHEAVLTAGRGATASDGLGSDGLGAASDGRAPGIPRFEIERGGDITYHGPGQLVGYPILDLGGFRKDLHWYVRTLEEALLRALAGLGGRGCRVAGHTGVWVGDERDPEPGSRDSSHEAAAAPDRVAERIATGRLRKIASIGVHVSRWVTWHGFALNVRAEALGPFRAIVPCGIHGVRMTSLESERVEASWERVPAEVAGGFGAAFGVAVGEVELADLEVRGLGLRSAPAGLSSDLA